MTRVLGIVRQWRTPNFRVIVDAIEEDAPDLDDTQSIANGVRRGDFVVFCARARVFYHGHEIAADYLGNCVYKSLPEFADHIICARETRRLRAQGHESVCGSMFASMVREVIQEARKELTSIRLRRIKT